MNSNYNSLFLQSIISLISWWRARQPCNKHPPWELCMKFPIIKWNTQQSTQQWTHKRTNLTNATELPKIQYVLHKPTYFSFVAHQGVFPWYCVHKKSHSLTICILKHFLCVILHIWRRFCNKIMQLKVDNILNSHYVVKFKHIWTMQWLIGVYF